MAFEEVQLMALASNDRVKKSDAVILLEGDGYNRIGQAIKIFQDGLAKKIVISGGFTGARPFTIPAQELAEKIYEAGIPKNKVILEERSRNTYEQGSEVMDLVKKNNWQKIILVASHFHQPRAFLTFLQAMKNAGLRIQIFNSPARDISWLDSTSLEKNRLQLLEEEFKKIVEYGSRGHLAAISEGIEYQRWKEEQK